MVVTHLDNREKVVKNIIRSVKHACKHQIYFWRDSGMKRLCSIYLRDLHGRHDGFVVERPSSLVLIWKDFRLDNFIQTQNFRDGIKSQTENETNAVCLCACVCVNLQW